MQQPHPDGLAGRAPEIYPVAESDRQSKEIKENERAPEQRRGGAVRALAVGVAGGCKQTAGGRENAKKDAERDAEQEPVDEPGYNADPEPGVRRLAGRRHWRVVRRWRHITGRRRILHARLQGQETVTIVPATLSWMACFCGSHSCHSQPIAPMMQIVKPTSIVQDEPAQSRLAQGRELPGGHVADLEPERHHPDGLPAAAPEVSEVRDVHDQVDDARQTANVLEERADYAVDDDEDDHVDEATDDAQAW